MFLGNEASLCSELLGPGALDPGAVILPYYAHSFWRYASHQLCNIQVDFPAESILKLEELDSQVKFEQKRNDIHQIKK